MNIAFSPRLSAAQQRRKRNFDRNVWQEPTLKVEDEVSLDHNQQHSIL